jgi:hypothetical protein
VQPSQAVLEVAGRARLSIATPNLELRVGQKKRLVSSRLDRMRVLIARRFPTGDLAVWLDGETEDDVRAGTGPRRVLALEALPPLDDAGLASANALERLGVRLEEALAQQGVQAAGAIELGTGENRALVELGAEDLTLWVRPLFRERVHKKLVLHADGRVRLMQSKGGERVLQLARRDEVLARGDVLAFEPAKGAGAEVWLPWIGLPERRELARLCVETFVGRLA